MVIFNSICLRIYGKILLIINFLVEVTAIGKAILKAGLLFTLLSDDYVRHNDSILHNRGQNLPEVNPF